MIKSLHFTKLEPEFEFAGFKFPRYLATLPSGEMSKRVAARKRPLCGAYYSAPEPLRGANSEVGFYLVGDRAMGCRYEIAEYGWFCGLDAYDVYKAIVLRLPKGRGFLAGYTLGEGMISAVRCKVFEDEDDAWAEAERIAERIAEINAYEEELEEAEDM